MWACWRMRRGGVSISFPAACFLDLAWLGERMLMICRSGESGWEGEVDGYGLVIGFGLLFRLFLALLRTVLASWLDTCLSLWPSERIRCVRSIKRGIQQTHTTGDGCP